MDSRNLVVNHDACLAAHKEGKRDLELAAMFHCSRAAITAWRKRHGLPVNKGFKGVYAGFSKAAKAAGVSREVWMAENDRGWKWCYKCKAWVHWTLFGVDHNRGDWTKLKCRTCTYSYENARRMALRRAAGIKQRKNPVQV